MDWYRACPSQSERAATVRGLDVSGAVKALFMVVVAFLMRLTSPFPIP